MEILRAKLRVPRLSGYNWSEGAMCVNTFALEWSFWGVHQVPDPEEEQVARS